MRTAPLLAAALTLSSLLVPRVAEACGGCAAPPKQVTTVTGHRMAFAVSPQQTVLWDQIQYSGSPEDFAWILPVTAGAKIELSHDAFFAALDAVTDPVITGPAPTCGSANAGCGTALSGADTPASGATGSSVQVISQSVVGPYDTVTIHSSDPNALYDWLTANGYAIPAGTQPVIDAYVEGGFDFIALRLAPGEGVQAMQPVRIITPGAGLTLPLRMIAVGAGANVGIVLYVIGDGRYEAQNFPNGEVDATKLTWSASQSQSNYSTLASQVIQANGGTWLTEYAGAQLLETTPPASTGGCLVGAGGVATYLGAPSVGGAYFCQCTESDAACTAPDLPGDAEEGAPDAAAAGDSGCSADACSTFDDLAVATAGLTTTWVTRMRTSLPASALGQDLVIQASASQTDVSNQLTALVYDDPSYSPCGQTSSGGGCNTTGDDSGLLGRGLVEGALGLMVTALLRRRAQRRRR